MSQKLTRKQFLRNAAALGVMTASNFSCAPLPRMAPARSRSPPHALAITMWDFSWLERRWDGAGFEDWDSALAGLKLRGYDVVRIDAFPHLVHFGADQEWELVPVWDQQVWGSPDVNRIRVMPELLEFVATCRKHGLRVALSSWFREDTNNVRMKISSPELLAAAWGSVLAGIRDSGLLDTVVYVDLCNEWPGDLWAPFLQPKVPWGEWHAPHSLQWMARAVELLRVDFPGLPLTFSFDNDRVENYLEHDLPFLDFFEHHVWAAKENGGEFYQLTDYRYGRFDPRGYRNLSLRAKDVYRQRPDYWQGLLTDKIGRLAAVAREAKRPLCTTECWGVVDYKDWPLLSWDWVKELCTTGVRAAAESGQWALIATSNFCGPQFAGMWRDVDWHLSMTKLIHNVRVNEEVRDNALVRRLLQASDLSTSPA